MKEVAVILPLQMEILRLSDLPKVLHIPWPVQKGEFSEYSSYSFFLISMKIPMTKATHSRFQGILQSRWTRLWINEYLAGVQTNWYVAVWVWTCHLKCLLQTQLESLFARGGIAWICVSAQQHLFTACQLGFQEVSYLQDYDFCAANPWECSF